MSTDLTVVNVNEATGEVSVTLADHAFRLKATMPNVASLQAALNVPGLRMLNAFVATGDARLAYHGMRCLCVSGNAATLDDILFPRWSALAIQAVSEALVAGLPDPETAEKGKPVPPVETTTVSPGGA